jgi:hypothetical protein
MQNLNKEYPGCSDKLLPFRHLLYTALYEISKTLANHSHYSAFSMKVSSVWPHGHLVVTSHMSEPSHILPLYLPCIQPI